MGICPLQLRGRRRGGLHGVRCLYKKTPNIKIFRPVDEGDEPLSRLPARDEPPRAPSRGRELYWLPGGGLLESDLDLKAIEALVGADTRRTTGTIEQIVAKY